MPTPNTPTTDPVATFLARARTQWRTANEAEATNRAEGYEDLRFLNLEQWPDRIKQLRSVPGRERPCLTIDQIGEPFRQLTNKQRESRPAIHVSPEDGAANQATADIVQGLIRAIEYDSDAQIAYATAFEGAVGPGWGYARLRSELEGEGPLQHIIVDMIENPFSVYLDPGTRKWDRRDMRYAFVVQDIPKDDYIAQFGESAVAKGGASLTDFSGLGDEAPDWFPEGAVRVAEYYYVTGPASKPVVMWAKINGLEILDGNEAKTAGRRIPGKTIPIRPCFGQVLNVNGKRIYRGIVRAARDAQMQYNFQNSALVEELALAPKSKVVMAEGQDEGYEGMWENANTEAFTALKYKPTTLGDHLVPPPGVTQFTDPAKIQSIVIAINQAKQDLRSTTGWYDATDPSRKNADQSGRAILARKESQNQGSVNYLDNFNRFVTSLGKVMLEWIPEIYDTEGRIIRTLGMEDEFERVMINAPYVDHPEQGPQALDPAAAKLAQDVKHFDLREGTYGIRVSPGTAYTTRKQEAAEWQFRLLEAQPELMQVFGDIAFKNLDGPGHEQIAERIGNTIPPQIKGDEQGQQDPQALQAELAQAKQAMQMMQAELQQAKQLLETDGIKAQAQGQIAQFKAQADGALETMKIQSEAAKQDKDNATKLQIAQLNAEVSAMEVRADLIKAQMTIDADLAKANLQQETARLLKQADLNGQREQGERESFERDQDRNQPESVN